VAYEVKTKQTMISLTQIVRQLNLRDNSVPRDRMAYQSAMPMMTDYRRQASTYTTRQYIRYGEGDSVPII